MNRAYLNLVVGNQAIASATACSGQNATQIAPPIAVAPTGSPATAAPPTAVPSPTTSASATGSASGSATFTSPSGYNGLATTIALLDTTEFGGNTNATFFSISHGQSGTGADATHPNRKITLEVNDRIPISVIVNF